MKITTLLSTALAAAALAGLAAAPASAAPTANGGDYVSRAVRSPNGKDVFVRVVKAPRMQSAALCSCPLTATQSTRPQAAKPPVQG